VGFQGDFRAQRDGPVGIDSDCDGDNDFDPDGDGFMPPFLPDGTPTEPAFTAYVKKYDLFVDLPDEVNGSGPASTAPRVLGPFDDCLDLGDPRVGPSALDAASVYPREWSALVGDNGDLPYDGIDTDCNRDNDFDMDRDAYYREEDDDAYLEYIALWGYEDETAAWAEVNPVAALAEPAPGDCSDSDALSYPRALELLERGEPPKDQDCDGDVNGSFWFEGSQDAPVMEWKDLTNPRVIRLGDVYAIIVGAKVLHQPGMATPLSQNAGVAIPFPLDVAQSQAVPSQPPFAWKGQVATQVIGHTTESLSLERCRDENSYPAKEVAYVYVDWVTVGAPSTSFSAYTLEASTTGRSLTVNAIDIIGSVAPAMAANGVSLNLDDRCNVVLGAISDGARWVTHGTGQVVDLAIHSDQDHAGTSIVPAFVPTDLQGPNPVITFELCDMGMCAEHAFGLDLDANDAPTPPDDLIVTSNSWERATSSWSKAEDLVVTAIPFGGLGLDVKVTPLGMPSESLTLFAGEQVVSAYGQLHDEELYVVAILETKGTRQVMLAYGEPQTLEVTTLNVHAEDLPVLAANAQPAQVALFVDDDRVAVAMTLIDPAAGEDAYADAVGWTFLGPPP